MNIGRNDSIGPVLSSPTMPSPQPHWKIATSRPIEAEIASMFISAALSGTTIERKAIIKSRMLTPITTPKKIGRRATICEVTSSEIAVMPEK